MEFDRIRIKEEAKARMRQARPRPWQVSLAYVIPLFLLPFLLILLLSLFIALPISPLHRLTDSSALPILLFLIYLIALAPLVLLQAGYCFTPSSCGAESPPDTGTCFTDALSSKKFLPSGDFFCSCLCCGACPFFS